MIILILILAVFFAINMGGSGITPTFAAEYGGKVISRKFASFLFGIFVIIGALLIGSRVSKTLSKNIIDGSLLTQLNVLFVFISVSTGLLLSNLLKIPASTSQMTVFSLVGIGLAYNQVKWEIFSKLIPLWLTLPTAAFVITFLIGKFIYPKLCNAVLKKKSRKLNSTIKFWDIISSCYTAFSIGSNNVANAAGPILAIGLMTNNQAVMMLAPFFGIGGYLLGKGNLKMIGKRVTNLDLLSAAIISLVTGTLLISASVIGLPQSLVQLNAFAIFGFALSIKNINLKTTGRSFIVWALTPLYAFVLSYLLCSFFSV